MPVLNAYSLKMMLPLCLVHCNGIRDRLELSLTAVKGMSYVNFD
jgi:hypothetical protein